MVNILFIRLVFEVKYIVGETYSSMKELRDKYVKSHIVYIVLKLNATGILTYNMHQGVAHSW